MAKGVINAYFVLSLSLLTLTAGRDCFSQQSPRLSFLNYKDNFYISGKTRLDSLAKYVHQLTHIRFSFNASRINGSEEIFFPAGKYSFEALLKRIQRSTSLHYILYNGYVIFQERAPAARAASGTARAARPGQKRPQPASRKPSRQAAPATDGNVAEEGRPLRPSKIQQPLRSTPVTFTRLPLFLQALPAVVSRTPGATSTTQGWPAADQKRQRPSLQGGLQWHVDLPLQGLDPYFTRAQGKSQLYGRLIPGLWLAKTLGSHSRVMVQLQPWQSFFAGGKTVTVLTSAPDSAGTISRSTAVFQTSGITGGICYQYPVDRRWMLGLGMQFTRQLSALLQDKTVQLATGQLVADSLYSIRSNAAGWQYIRTWLGSPVFECGYTFHKVQAGCMLTVPVTGLTRPFSCPVNGRLLLRWRL